MKICFKCKIEKPITEFGKDKNKKSGLNTYCKECKRINDSKSVYKARNTEKGFLDFKINGLYTPSANKNRGNMPECTKDEIRKHYYEYVEKHGRNCFYCREPWTYIHNGYIPNNHDKKNMKNKRSKDKLKNLSFDRLDSSKTYFINNIIFCCVECNLSKRDISFKMIKRLYEIITERNL
jgi:hypothetical protein